MKRLSILIPVFNEENTLQTILERVYKQTLPDLEYEVVLVDDASTDRSRDVLQQYMEQHPDRRILHFAQPANRGKGAALRKCLEMATGDYLIVQDADLEYDPRDYPKLMEPILDGRAQVVYGSRFLGGPHRVLLFWHFMANNLLTLLSNMLNNVNLTDMETGYKAFTRAVADRLILKSDRFGFEPEFTAKVAKLRVPIYEVPISYSGRDYSEGKKIGVKDGFAAFWWIFRFRFFN